MRPDAVLPRHVRACIHSPTCDERWAVWWWRKDDPGKQHRAPYSCGSWRCKVCARWEAAVTFARYMQAVRGVEATQAPGMPHGWVYLVLTLDRDGYYGGKPWKDVNDAFRALGKLSRKVKDRIGRRWGWTTRDIVTVNKKTGKVRVRHVRTIGNRWVETVEVHRSGWPHLNLVMWCPELAAALRLEHAERLEDPEVADAVELARDAWSRREPVPAMVRERARRATLVGGELRDIIEVSGWGRQSTAEVARSIEAVASYGLKLAGMHEAGMGELAKITQAPLNAPQRFKRLRVGLKFFPARYKNADVTGCLFRRQRDSRGDWRIVGMNAPEQPECWLPVKRAYEAERALIDAEEHALSQGRIVDPMRRASIGTSGSTSATRERALQSRDLSALDAMKALPDWQIARAAARARRGAA